jgi:hypothetical protein
MVSAVWSKVDLYRQLVLGAVPNSGNLTLLHHLENEEKECTYYGAQEMYSIKTTRKLSRC